MIAASMGNNVIGRIVTRRLVTSLLRRMGVRIATGSIAKYVPLIGSAVAASISFGAMRAVGMAHIDDCYATAKALIAGPDGAIGQGGGKSGGVVRA